MNFVNVAATTLNIYIDAATSYLKQHGTVIAILLVLAYAVRNQIAKNPGLIGDGHILAQGSSAARNATSREEQLRQVRLRQQEVANERAHEAAKLRKEKEQKEAERKNKVATPESTKGAVSGKSAPEPQGYSPMQPWTSHSSGYRPARRNVNRG